MEDDETGFPTSVSVTDGWATDALGLGVDSAGGEDWEGSRDGCEDWAGSDEACSDGADVAPVGTSLRDDQLRLSTIARAQNLRAFRDDHIVDTPA